MLNHISNSSIERQRKTIFFLKNRLEEVLSDPKLTEAYVLTIQDLERCVEESVKEEYDELVDFAKHMVGTIVKKLDERDRLKDEQTKS